MFIDFVLYSRSTNLYVYQRKKNDIFGNVIGKED